MAKKKPFALRLDEEMLKSIEKWASDEFRSTNGQIEYILNQALKKAGRLKKKEDQQDKNES
ncbi:MAG: Arc family DNA-binding protein [Bacteroidota bacterium]